MRFAGCSTPRPATAGGDLHYSQVADPRLRGLASIDRLRGTERKGARPRPRRQIGDYRDSKTPNARTIIGGLLLQSRDSEAPCPTREDARHARAKITR